MQGILSPFLAIALAALIAYLSLVPGDSRAVRWMPPWLQNAGHVGCYAGLSFLCFLALAPAVHADLTRAATAFVIATGFGVLMEWLQGSSPGRHASLLDASRNAAGALIGVVTAMLLPW